MNVSADTPEQVVEAVRAGWPVVTTVASTDTRRRWREGGVEYVTCPNQSMGERGVACNACFLCQKRDRPFVVAFRHHGPGAKRADRRLEELTPLPMAGD
ncbi:hypothetical protein [Deinococcus sp. S9]|uniref:DUF7227 family protein n=1 Tax=Deinococcus sp. S9 TaxID=2545754 RepID=UPI001055CAB3|nr:hypothetical protein [Deinococcus sp. S9]TDE87395.1 hypothetical protein E0686_02570 [Deinococcus sp. S9]